MSLTRRRRPLAERFMAKLPAERLADACWEWQASRSREGYGRINSPEAGVLLAHRVSYDLFVGPIPDGTQIDHLCRNRACVNPSHLEAVAPQTNFLRGIHNSARTVIEDRCKRDHPFTANAYVVPKTGARQCRECRRLRRLAGAA